MSSGLGTNKSSSANSDKEASRLNAQGLSTESTPLGFQADCGAQMCPAVPGQVPYGPGCHHVTSLAAQLSSDRHLNLAAAEPGPPTLGSEAWQGLGFRSGSSAGTLVFPIFRRCEVPT